jgi:hypothetical protein
MLNTKSILTQDYAEKNPIRATISSVGSIAYNGAGFINDSLRISRKALTLVDVELDAMIAERKLELVEETTVTKQQTTDKLADL